MLASRDNLVGLRPSLPDAIGPSCRSPNASSALDQVILSTPVVSSRLFHDYVLISRCGGIICTRGRNERTYDGSTVPELFVR